jgi:hypothetical protein
MTTTATVPPVTGAELRACADQLELGLSEQELDMYAGFMAGLTADFNLVAGMEAPRLLVKYPRDQGYRPTDAENRFNAWYWKMQHQGCRERQARWPARGSQGQHRGRRDTDDDRFKSARRFRTR